MHNYVISDLKLPDTIKGQYILEHDILSGLSRINIFIGENNSGKSRFMRELFNDGNLNFKVADYDWDKIDRIIDSHKNHLIHRARVNIREKPPEEYLYEYNMTEIACYFIREHKSLKNQVINGMGKYLKLPSTGLGKILGHQELSGFISKIILSLTNAMKSDDTVYMFNRVYIPVLRGLRPFTDGNENNNYYRNRTIGDYFEKEEDGYVTDRNVGSIFTGLEFYDELDKLAKGDRDDRGVKEEYEEFLGKQFFDGKRIEITPKYDEEVVFIWVDGEEERPVYLLGDGIQQLIIMTFPVFVRSRKKLQNDQRNDVLLFIEEPELYLHPGLQRKLMEVLNDHDLFPSLQTFITTHSNHLLDITLDIDNTSVYRFCKRPASDKNRMQFEIIHSNNEDVELLKSIGVYKSSVFLSNCTIWVEGITDRMYFRHFLKVYQMNEFKEIKYQEDLHYSFVEYGGSNIVHWSFLDREEKQIDVERLCGRVFLIADRDSGKEKKHSEIKKRLGSRYYPLECLEVENLLEPHIIEMIIKEYEGEEVQIKSFEIKDYQNIKLGDFIKSIVKSRRNWAVPSGSIKNKKNFAQKAISNINSMGDMSEEAVNICKKMIRFIKKNNPNCVKR